MNLLAPLDYPRQAAANLFAKLGEGDFLGAAPGLAGVAGGLAASPFVGPGGGVLLGSLLGGALQGGGLALDEGRFAAPTTGDVVEGLGGDREDFLQNAAAQLATDPLAYGGLFHGAKLGAQALRPVGAPTFRPTSTTLPGGLKGGSGVSYSDLVTKAERALPAAGIDPAALAMEGRMPFPGPGARMTGPEAMRAGAQEMPALPAAAPSARDRMLAAGEGMSGEHLASLEDQRRAALAAARDLEQDLAGGAFPQNPLLARLGVYGGLGEAEEAALLAGASPSMNIQDMARYGSVVNDAMAAKRLGEAGMLKNFEQVLPAWDQMYNVRQRGQGIARMMPPAGVGSDVEGWQGVMAPGEGADPLRLLFPLSGNAPTGSLEAANRVARVGELSPRGLAEELATLRERGLPVDPDLLNRQFAAREAQGLLRGAGAATRGRVGDLEQFAERYLRPEEQAGVMAWAEQAAARQRAGDPLSPSEVNAFAKQLLQQLFLAGA